jgi:uncharacterized protein
MTNTELKNKSAHLQALLHSYGRVAVAYSGGVDSSLLLRVACVTLGPNRVTALHAISCLTPAPDQKKAEKRVVSQSGFGCAYRAVKLSPLRWPEFVANTEQRCYFCKKRMYGILQSELQDNEILLDGTNSDDLHADRPGLAAIREIFIQTPLAVAGLSKKEVRALAKELGVTNWNQPSNSCLATRIPVHQKITATLLKQIQKAELFLQKQGFPACRVKPANDTLTIQVPNNDLEHFLTISKTIDLAGFLKDFGFDAETLNITIRESL